MWPLEAGGPGKSFCSRGAGQGHDFPRLALGTWLAWGPGGSWEAYLSFVTNGANRAKAWRPRRADVATAPGESDASRGATLPFQSYGTRGASGAGQTRLAVSSGGARSAWHAGLAWEAGVSFVAFEPYVEVDLTGLALGSRLAHEPRRTLRTGQSFQTVPAGQASVTLGSWLSWETYFSGGSLWPWGPTKLCCVTDEATVSFLTFFSNFARQPRLPWNSRRTLVPWRPRLAFHDSICVARLPRGPGGAGGAGKPVPSTGSWQRHARQAGFTLLSSVAREAGGTNQPRSREAWRAWLAWYSWETFGTCLPFRPRTPWVPGLSFLSQRSRANNSSGKPGRTCFTFLSL